jgi:DNA-binding NarL/FixJ family response regulator
LQIKVFIVSNVRLHREGLAALLRGCPSIQVLGADNVQDTQSALRRTPTDVALIDAQSPGESDTVLALRRICAKVRILAVGIRETASEVLACAAAASA